MGEENEAEQFPPHEDITNVHKNDSLDNMRRSESSHKPPSRFGVDEVRNDEQSNYIPTRELIRWVI